MLFLYAIARLQRPASTVLAFFFLSFFLIEVILVIVLFSFHV